jgi:hypothetical protein
MSDEIPEESAGAVPALKPILFNILSIFFLVLACLCPAFSLLIFAAPDSGLNPLPPAGAGPAAVVPASTDTPIISFPPTWTPTATVELAFTATLTETGPATPSETSVYNPNPQNTPSVFFPFVVEGGNPTYSASPNGCTWMGVVGTVFDLNHTPLSNLIVQIHGTLAGQTFDQEQVTGALGADRAGAFEFQLADKPTLSLNSFWILLLDGNRSPISDKIVFNTYAACDKNLITVNFIQVNP